MPGAPIPADAGLAWPPLEPPPVPEQRVAFAAGRLAQLREDELVLYDTRDGSVALRTRLEGARRVVGFADGTVFAVGAAAAVRVRGGKTDAEPLGRVPLLPGSMLIAPARGSERLWVLGGSEPTLFEHELGTSSSAILPIRDVLDLEQWDRRALGRLADDSFLASGARWARWQHGKRRALDAPKHQGEIWRVLGASRAERAWLVWQDGRLELVAIRDFLASATAEPGPRPWDAASGADRIAVVRVEQPTAARPRFELAVFTERGERTLRLELPRATAPDRETELRAEISDRAVSISGDGALVAVGGATRVAAHRSDGGAQVFAAAGGP
jgi:hypothetical protein